MIVIHIDNNSPDAKILSRIYEGLDRITLSYNRSKSNIKRLLRITGDEPVMLLGHGSPQGLFNVSQNGYAVGSECVEWLRGRPVIGIFCYASDFADKYGLHGFFTSMFISNMTEEEKEELKDICTMYDCDMGSDYECFGIKIFNTSRYGTAFESDYMAIDWLNKKMFDYRGLIPMGLALEAPECMYNIKSK